jgi:hypothetical protein
MRVWIDAHPSKAAGNKQAATMRMIALLKHLRRWHF